MIHSWESLNTPRSLMSVGDFQRWAAQQRTTESMSDCKQSAVMRWFSVTKNIDVFSEKNIARLLNYVGYTLDSPDLERNTDDNHDEVTSWWCVVFGAALASSVIAAPRRDIGSVPLRAACLLVCSLDPSYVRIALPAWPIYVLENSSCLQTRACSLGDIWYPY